MKKLKFGILAFVLVCSSLLMTACNLFGPSVEKLEVEHTANLQLLVGEEWVDDLIKGTAIYSDDTEKDEPTEEPEVDELDELKTLNPNSSTGFFKSYDDTNYSKTSTKDLISSLNKTEAVFEDESDSSDAGFDETSRHDPYEDYFSTKGDSYFENVFGGINMAKKPTKEERDSTLEWLKTKF